ncbi:MAG: hydroxylamine reductase [bacterium]|nr:hydroxylamine reductase [bacterium]
MFCFQCQETAKNLGCSAAGVCGKRELTANLQDLLIYTCKGIAFYGQRLPHGTVDNKTGRFLIRALFTTVTNVAWDDDAIIALIKQALLVRNGLRARIGSELTTVLPDCALWSADSDEDIISKASSAEVRITASADEDVRSLRELLILGCKGIAAYAEHAAVLGCESAKIYAFLAKALDSTTENLPLEEMIALVMQAGECAVSAMALLDEANTKTYGHPEITEVNLGAGHNPGILISGHDLKDMEELLRQTEGTGVDVYTHSEMLAAHYYPAFKKFAHFKGNYGSSWWHQADEFAAFNGPIVMTTNCLVPLKNDCAYADRLFTTGVVSYPGVKHIADRPEGGAKDFSAVVEMAKRCTPPREIENGKLIGGFAHSQVLSLADKVIEAVKSGAIRRFVVMAGCDGRQKGRSYYTEVAEKLPKDTVILTAGCAKYRYIKLNLGEIGGIPRVLDAGQCNDSYSLALIALKLQEAFGLKDINELPISFDIAWYEQKAVAVLLALLYLGVKGIRLGPTLPAFLSPNVAKVLVEKFSIKPIASAEEDIAAMLAGA